MFKIHTASGSLLLFLLTLAWVTDLAGAEFREVAIDYFPHGEVDQGYPIQLRFAAEHLPGGLPLEGREVGWSAGTVEQHLTDYFSVLRVGSVEGALPFWRADEQAEARQTLAPLFEQQRELFAQVSQSRLYSKLRYGRYLLVAVRHERPGAESLTAIYPLVDGGEGWALSNGLQDDPILQLIFLTLYEGLGFDRPFEAVH